MIDGIVLGRQRAMTAGVGNFQFETQEDLFGGLQACRSRLAVLDIAATGVEFTQNSASISSR